MSKKKQANRNTAKFDIERQYIVFIDSEITSLGWNESDVVKFRQLWTDGMSVEDIAKILVRTPREVKLLMHDQDEKELIELRPT